MPHYTAKENLFQRDLVAALKEVPWRRRQVHFVLGTDEFIDQERRVALTPRHIRLLRNNLEAVGLEPRITVISGAGARAIGSHGEDAFDDDQYTAVGADVVAADAMPGLPPVDVLHALKEPTAYESESPGEMLRIGALHLASKPPGLCTLLERRNFAAVIDGGTVGSCSYLLHGGDRTPIVGSMSRFAGWVSGRLVVEGLDAQEIDGGRIVVVGGGIAGQAAIERMASKADPLVVIDPWQPTHERLRQVLPGLGVESFELLEELDAEVMDDAVGIVFAHRSGAKKAEKVCDYDLHIRRMRSGAVIADIAIDQGGSIAHDGYLESDDATASRRKYIDLLTPEFIYYAETNMPREEPHVASEVHGDASLPYVTALLALCAAHGDTAAVRDRILRREPQTFADRSELDSNGFVDCVVQDLRNGTQLTTDDHGIRITDRDIENDPDLSGWVRQCAAGGR